MKTTLIFVRHGQSESNLSNTFTGQSDVPLTALGLRQAARTAEYLRRAAIDRIYASDLRRAMQTAEPTAEDHGLPILPAADLREIQAGAWERMEFGKIAARYPREFDTWLHDLGNASCPLGESVADVYRRAAACVDRIVAENRGKCVALFSHATPLRVLWCHWNGLSLKEVAKVPWSANASVTTVEYRDSDAPRIVQYGYDGHLTGLITELPKTV